MKKAAAITLMAITTAMVMTGCGEAQKDQTGKMMSDNRDERGEAGDSQKSQASQENSQTVVWTPEVTELEDGLWAVRYDGDYGFEAFLEQGGASSDEEVIQFLKRNVFLGTVDVSFETGSFGCSTLSVIGEDGGYLSGRNFDWNSCQAMVVGSKPEKGYASVSTVNADFIRQGGGLGGLALGSDQILTIAALYATLDGMNDQGLCVSANMIQDSSVISQHTEKPDITTTTAVRLLLNQAADVEEALELLRQYDLHGSMGMMVHFAIADANGNSVAVEYINNEMTVTRTPVVTNFYLAEGEKQGIGTSQSHERYDLLMERLREQETMTWENVRDALNQVSKDNFGEFESTEWSIVFDQGAKTARYYHREDYENSYLFVIE